MKTMPFTAMALAFAGLSLSTFAGDARPPNILLIVADDLGYGELGVQGFTHDIPTPHIDSIATGGTRFTSGYVSGPYCSPTRAGLLTGRYQQRFGHEFNPGPATTAETRVGLDLAQKTLGDRFQAAGYTTAWIGKSHLGYEPEFHPLKRGFDFFYGFLGGAHDYLDGDGKGRDPIQRDGRPAPKFDYLTEEIGREAVRFIDTQKGKPWLTYLAFNAVHAPLEAPAKYLSRFPGITDSRRQKFAGLLSALDDAVGAVLAKVRESGEEENTLIFFIADNGGPTPSTTSGNGPLRGYKAQTWEGGIRVPSFVRWKGHLPEGKVDDRPVIQLDILPTALAAAGIETPQEWKLDGVNLLPYLRGQNTAPPHDALFWRMGQQLAVRQGEWKLVKALGGALGPGELVGNAETSGAQLYHLAQDIGEKNNLAASQPEKVKELAAAWDVWNAGNAEPKWAPGRRLARKNASVAEPAAPALAKPEGPWKQGDQVASAAAPQLAGRGFTIAADIEPTAPGGVIAALGAGGHGVALYLQDGKLAFALRQERQLTTVLSSQPLPPGAHHVEARLDTAGGISLLLDDQPVGQGQASALLATQPKEGLTIGHDGRGAVGDYNAPHPFSGKVANVRITLLPVKPVAPAAQ